MKREIKHPGKQKPTGAYSAGLVVDGWVFVSGQGPLDITTGRVVEGTIEEQTRLTLARLAVILQTAKCGLQEVVKCTCYLADIGDFDRFNKVYAEFFHGVRPARTTVQSVLWGGIKVEIDAIARIPQE